jgi:hypothetical protein
MNQTEFKLHSLLDFTINKASNQLIAYDSGKRQLNIYNLKDGHFLSSLSTSTFAPMGMASVDGVFFFDNPDHFNYPDNKELHYSLLYSTIGNKIDNRFFEHTIKGLILWFIVSFPIK